MMNAMEEIRKIMHSKQPGPDCEISNFELSPKLVPSSPRPVYSLNTTEYQINSKNVLSPLIFCNKKYKTKVLTASKKRLVVFENMLSNVVYAYYNTNYEINTIMRSMTEVATSQKETEPEAPSPEIKKKRGRKRKLRLENGAGEAQDGTSEPIDLVDEINLLDFLVSPLKFDFEYGKLKREVVSKGDGYL